MALIHETLGKGVTSVVQSVRFPEKIEGGKTAELTVYGLYTSFPLGMAKQLSLSRTTALMSAFFSPLRLGKALDRGTGR